ncbi:MAG TPA: cysteine rich repeat-containing protein [Caulobacteraceae bacterium]|nr:cysteine rich repeat-containing protein [Caulobacteraceae bacterium]
MSHRRFRLALPVGLVAAGFAIGLAGAAEGGSRPSGFTVMKICKPDIKEHCPHMRPGSSALKRCLKDNFSGLSAPCQDVINRYEGKASDKPPE